MTFTCTHCSRPILTVGQRCSNDALCKPIDLEDQEAIGADCEGCKNPDCLCNTYEPPRCYYGGCTFVMGHLGPHSTEESDAIA